MTFPTVAIAFSTYYPRWYQGTLKSIKNTDKVRGDLSLEFIELALQKKCRVVVVDSGSAKTYRKKLQAFEGIKVVQCRAQRRSPSRRRACKEAAKLAGVEVIVLSEPEKVSLIKDCLAEMVEPIQSGRADIVIPKREEKLFRSSYPDYQIESEIEGNELFNEELKTHGILGNGTMFDVFFGPRVFRNDSKVLRLFMKKYSLKMGKRSFPETYFDPEQLSNVLFFPLVQALLKKWKVQSVEVPFKYPLLQKQNEEFGSKELFVEKRRAQRLGIIVNLMHFLYLLKK